MLTTVFGNVMRDAAGGGKAWISSLTKRAAPGAPSTFRSRTRTRSMSARTTTASPSRCRTRRCRTRSRSSAPMPTAGGPTIGSAGLSARRDQGRRRADLTPARTAARRNVRSGAMSDLQDRRRAHQVAARTAARSISTASSSPTSPSIRPSAIPCSRRRCSTTSRPSRKTSS